MSTLVNNRSQGPYTSGHLKFKAIQDFSRLREKEIQDCFNDICTFKRSKLSYRYIFYLTKKTMAPTTMKCQLPNGFCAQAFPFPAVSRHNN